MERLLQLISKVGGINSVAPAASIYDAGFSSVRVLELLLALEQEFGVSIPDKDFMTTRTPQEIWALIERLQERKAA
jgi:acyl carrier protein